MGRGAAVSRPGFGLVGERELLGRRLSVASSDDFEGYLVPFVQRGKTGPFDGADVDEYVLGAILRLNETITLDRVEPLDSTSSHDHFLFRQIERSTARCRAPWRRSQCRGRNLAVRSRGQSRQQQRLRDANRPYTKSMNTQAPSSRMEGHLCGLVGDPRRDRRGRSPVTVHAPARSAAPRAAHHAPGVARTSTI